MKKKILRASLQQEKARRSYLVRQAPKSQAPSSPAHTSEQRPAAPSLEQASDATSEEPQGQDAEAGYPSSAAYA